MSELTPEEKKALDEFKQIRDLLAVPTRREPLADSRKWTLSPLDKQALADRPPDEAANAAAQAYSASKQSQTGQSSAKGAQEQTGR